MSEELTYTFFDDEGPCTLTETELVNDYMELRAAGKRYVSCQFEAMRMEKGSAYCPHVKTMGGDQDFSCYAALVNALGKRWQGEAFS